MNASDIPAAFPIAFASSAAGAYIRAIPQTAPTPSGTDAPAGLDLGFPPQTFATSGAIPPNGKDFNGLFNQITSWSRWQKAGAPVFYDSGFSTAIGGYPKGAQLASASTPGLTWISTADGNATNPDSGGSANWLGSGATSSGNNGNGYWEKRPSGVLDQWGVVAGSYGQGEFTQAFPQDYVDTGSIQININAINATGGTGVSSDMWCQSVSWSTSSFVGIFQSSNTTALAQGYSWRAIGRWY